MSGNKGGNRVEIDPIDIRVVVKIKDNNDNNHIIFLGELDVNNLTKEKILRCTRGN